MGVARPLTIHVLPSVDNNPSTYSELLSSVLPFMIPHRQFPSEDNHNAHIMEMLLLAKCFKVCNICCVLTF